jgi:hypothetical protein
VIASVQCNARVGTYSTRDEKVATAGLGLIIDLEPFLYSLKPSMGGLQAPAKPRLHQTPFVCEPPPPIAIPGPCDVNAARSPASLGSAMAHISIVAPDTG